MRLGALRDLPDKLERVHAGEQRALRTRAAREGRHIEQRDHRNVGRRRNASGSAAGRERQHELRDEIPGPTCFRGVEADQREPRGRRAAGRKHRRAAHGARLHRDERTLCEGILQPTGARQLAVEVAGKAIVRDEDVRFAAQAPSERRAVASRAPPPAGASQ